MKYNNLSKLGYLMEILSINVSELSNSINIERTTVSKWKNGRRFFLRSSNHFEPIVEYLIQKNNNTNGNILTDFFGSIYPNKNTNDENYILNCIRNYLAETNDCNTHTQTTDDNALYQGNFTVYAGIEGRQNAIMNVLDTALKSNNKGFISILESSVNAEFLLYEKDFATKVINKIKNLLDKGFEVEFTYVLDEQNLPNPQTTEILMDILFHKNLTQFISTNIYKEEVYFTYYLYKNKVLIIGIKGEDSLIYTTKFTDPLTINNSYLLYANQKSVTKPLVSFNKISDQKSLLSILNNYVISKDIIYYNNCSLWLASMSYDLLMDILLSNNVPKDIIEHTTDYYIIIKKLVLNYDNKKGGLIFSQESVTESMEKEFVIHYELTALAGYDVLLTHDQFVRHIEDTIAFINENPKIPFKTNDNLQVFPYSLCLNSVGLLIANKVHVKNQYRYIYIENSLLAKTHIKLVDNATSNVPDIYSDNTYIKKLLRYLIDNQSQ